MSDKYSEIQDAIRATSEKLLKEERVKMIIGYGVNSLGETNPVFVRDAEKVDKLLWNKACYHNLATYLARPHIQKHFPVGIVVKGCDLRAVNMLIKEHVVNAEDVVTIGVPCSGIGEPAFDKCQSCEVQAADGADELVPGTPEKVEGAGKDAYADVDEMDKMPPDERWAFWKEQFEKCVRCYACRQVCPMCYCKRCIVEKTEPQWVEFSQHLRGNLSWNAVRAFHLAGRCVGCGECERVCPANIPLGKLNSKMAKYMLDMYEYKAGMKDQRPTPFTAFDMMEKDSDEGIL